uniref:PRE_C2HC domain-containing protein n=1 Tax=Syphacia muris TaxID=451379 RepID=A0A0N5ACT0_9BILA
MKFKYLYLLSFLEGEPYNDVCGYESSDMSYELALDKLQKKCGNNNQIIMNLYEKLEDIPFTLSTEALKTYEAAEITLGKLITIVDKIPDKESSIDKLREFLRIQISYLQTGYRSKRLGMKSTENCVSNKNSKKLEHFCIKTPYNSPKPKYNKVKCEKVNFGNKLQRSNSTPDISSKMMLAAERPAKKDNKIDNIKKTCIFCDGDHFCDNCHKYIDLDARLKVVKKKALCEFCLKKDRSKTECQTPIRLCLHCKQPHYNAMCPAKFKSTVQPRDGTTQLTLETSGPKQVKEESWTEVLEKQWRRTFIIRRSD